jgi:hypothetical protein
MKVTTLYLAVDTSLLTYVPCSEGACSAAAIHDACCRGFSHTWRGGGAAAAAAAACTGSPPALRSAASSVAAAADEAVRRRRNIFSARSRCAASACGVRCRSATACAWRSGVARKRSARCSRLLADVCPKPQVTSAVGGACVAAAPAPASPGAGGAGGPPAPYDGAIRRCARVTPTCA